MDEKLVEQIVKAVLAKLKDPVSINNLTKKKTLLIGNINDCSMCIEKLSESHVIDEVTSDSKISDYESIVLPSLSLIQISAIWNCMPVDEISKWAIDAILSQKKILMFKDNVQINDKSVDSKSNLYKRVLGYFEELKNDGFTYVDELISNPQIIVENEKSLSSAKLQEKDCKVKEVYENKLLNEKEAVKLKNKGIKELSISKKTIITPLAKDLLSNFKIKFIQE